ncbi:MAG: serine/threonine-protein kinase [Planctomycetota bacterium]
MTGGDAGPPRLGERALSHLRAVIDRPLVDGTRYELGELLGRGGMGSVYRARDRELERDVALKVLTLPDPGGEFGARLAAEARVLARLEHPGIVPVHDVGVLPDGRPYYAMKLVRGERLDDRLRQGLPAGEAHRVFARVAEAVAFAHSHGVVHCDLTPQNVMSGAFGEVLVLDWGLATASGRPLRAGTPGFLAPEQRTAEAPVDARTDVFALGRLLGELQLPGRAVAAIVGKATAAQPAARYASVPELAADVARAAQGLPVSALPEGPLALLARFYRHNRAAVWLVLAYAVLRIGFELVRSLGAGR